MDVSFILTLVIAVATAIKTTLIEYITIIKMKGKIKSPLEILNGELKKASDLTNMNATDTKGKQFSLDARRGDKPQYKLADMLYIYDMKKNGCTHIQIINKILEKYPNKKNFSEPLADSRKQPII